MRNDEWKTRSFILHSSFCILHFCLYDPSALPVRKLHIFTAIHAEANAIRAQLPEGVSLSVIGIRAVRLPEIADASAILMAGFGGGLDPILKVGDVVWDDPPGVIYTSTEIVSTAAEKALLRERTRARVVDMENGIVRALAVRLGVPFFGVRSVSDTAKEAVDPLVLKLVDETGRSRAGAMARALLHRPQIIPTLNRLRINSGIAGRALAKTLRTFLDENKELYR
jgi:hypothetical protein